MRRRSQLAVGMTALIAGLVACNSIIGTRGDLFFDADAGLTNDGDASGMNVDGGMSTDRDGASMTDGGGLVDASMCPSVDTTSDSKNCGACKHDCLGGACAGSRCQPVPVVSNGAGQPFALAVDGTNIYYSDISTGIIYSLPKGAAAGTTPTALLTTADPLIYDLVATGGELYYSFGSSGQGSLETVQPDGGGRRAIVPDASVPRGLSVDNSRIYWATPDDDTPQIRAANRVGDAGVTVLAPAEDDAEFTYVDGLSLYWSGENLTKVRHCTLPACPVVTSYLSGLSGPFALASNSKELFIADGTSEMVYESDKTAGSGFATLIAGNQAEPYSIATDDKDIYWVNLGDYMISFSNGSIRHCPIGADGKAACAMTDGGEGDVIMNSTENPRQIVMDSTAVYWTVQQEGSVYRLAR